MRKFKELFPGANFYQLQQPLALDNIEQQLEQFRYKPIGEHTANGAGFYPMNDDPDTPLTYQHEGQTVGIFLQASRDVKMSDVNARLEKQVKNIEESTGNPVTKKQRNDIKESIIKELMPFAPVKIQRTTFVISNRDQLLIVLTKSDKVAESALAYLRKSLGSLPVRLPRYKALPAEILARWLRGNHTHEKHEQIYRCSIGNVKAKGRDGEMVQFKNADLRGEVMQAVFKDLDVLPVEIDLVLFSDPLAGEPTLTFNFHIPKHAQGLVVSRLELPGLFMEQVDDLDDEGGQHEFKTATYLVSSVLIKLFNAIGYPFGGLITWEDVKEKTNEAV
ncbi:recombination-associated protein RdgC [Rheinheimera sp.]|uniref:recombination-associated protein RdgC n=1 Tax=Rheinheimera sp. TaxID=1869214 RepID=UPI00307F7EA3